MLADGGKIRWGMTVSQVKALYPGVFADDNNTLNRDVIGALSAKEFEITDTLKMNVGVMISKTSRLVQQVNLDLSADAAHHSEAPYRALLDELTRKYGEPSKREVTGEFVPDSEITWLLPSTTITLTRIGADDLSVVILSYARVKKSAL
jgi:hypothetical protein